MCIALNDHHLSDRQIAGTKGRPGTRMTNAVRYAADLEAFKAIVFVGEREAPRVDWSPRRALGRS